MANGRESGDGKSQLIEIQTQIAAALSELFARALKDGMIVDRKERLPRFGLVQDCEFGMILLLGRAWLKEQNAVLPANLQDDAIVRDFIVNLAVNTATALITRRPLSEKGGEDTALPVFFSGSPYTRFTKKREDCFSANLDAAMLVLGFFAPALKEYHSYLPTIPLPAGAKEVAPWINDSRDLIIYICKCGVEYAEHCRVKMGSTFVGFSCDPNSLLNDDNDAPFLEPFDRLFFTWTAAESAHDLHEWLKYLPGIATGIPKDEIESLRQGIQNLRNAVDDAAAWCKGEFYDAFRSLAAPVNIPLIVQRVQSPAGSTDPTLPGEVDKVRAYVQHVYHLSQYAAIRSLAPMQVTIREVSEICDKLDTLVNDDVIGSGLDAAPQETLSSTLTRNYCLGRRVDDSYDDDAYYPLVVRSMAGLLSRTMDSLGQSGNPAEISKLVLDFRRVLGGHYKNLIKRRAKDETVLWSFAVDKPYVLYATQRTLFASLAYADFLVKMQDVDDKSRTDEALETTIKSILSEKLVDVLLGPAIKDIVSVAKTNMAERRESGEGSSPLFPKTEWAASVVRDWTEKFAHDFDTTSFRDDLLERAEKFVHLHHWAFSCKQPPEKHRERLDAIKDAFRLLMKEYGFGEGAAPTASDLLPHLLRDLLPNNLSDRMKETRWDLVIKDAMTLDETLRNVPTRPGKTA